MFDCVGAYNGRLYLFNVPIHNSIYAIVLSWVNEEKFDFTFETGYRKYCTPIELLNAKCDEINNCNINPRTQERFID